MKSNRSSGFVIVVTNLTLLGTIPWLFFPESPAEAEPVLFFGIPSWGAYAVLASAVYALVVSLTWGTVWRSEQ
jgi:hypothetical protein